MTKTVEIDKTETTQDEVFSQYVKSKEIREGTNLDGLSVNVEKRLFPKKSKSRFLPQADGGHDEGSTLEVSEGDIKYTILGKRDGVFQNIREDAESTSAFGILRISEDDLIDAYMAEGFEDEPVYVVKRSTGDIVKCDIGYVVSVEFRDSMGNSQSVEKKFNSEEKANEFAKEVRDKKGEVKLSYDNGLNLRKSSKSVKNSLKKSLKEDKRSASILIFSYLYWIISIPTISTSFAVLMMSMITAIVAANIAVKGYLDYNSYDDVYHVEDSSGGVELSVPDEVDMTKEITVEVERNSNSVVINTEEIDTHWEFSTEDGILSEEGTEFFDSIGRDIIIDENRTTMKASRGDSTDESVESVDGEWYLSKVH